MTLRGQKRKRGGLTTGGQRAEGTGRARSKFTGVYQQSRGNGWFASICVDKSVCPAPAAVTAPSMKPNSHDDYFCLLVSR